MTETAQPSRYIPKVVPGVENLVLMEVQKPQGSGRRSAKGPLVPKGRQDPKRYYCDSCDSNYNRPDELVRHKKRDCGKSDPEYFCDECGKGYLKENGVASITTTNIPTSLYGFAKNAVKGFILNPIS